MAKIIFNMVSDLLKKQNQTTKSFTSNYKGAWEGLADQVCIRLRQWTSRLSWD